MGENYIGRLIRRQAECNEARLLIDRVVMSPEAMHDIQSEVATGTPSFFYEGGLTGLRQTLLGIPLTIDPRLDGSQMHIEIDL